MSETNKITLDELLKDNKKPIKKETKLYKYFDYDGKLKDSLLKERDFKTLILLQKDYFTHGNLKQRDLILASVDKSSSPTLYIGTWED